MKKLGYCTLILLFLSTFGGAQVTKLRVDNLLVKETPWIDVRSYGAVGDGSNDDTAEIQDAIDAAIAEGRGIVYFPPGIYKTSGVLTINESNIQIAGAGVGTTFIYPIATGDVFYFKPPGSDPLNFRSGIHDLAVYTQVDTSSGAILHGENLSDFFFYNLDFNGHFGGIWFDSITRSHGSNITLGTDANFSSLKTSSYLLKLTKASSGSQYTPSVRFSNLVAYGQGSHGSSYYLDKAILIQAADGVYFDGLWAGWANYAFCMIPQSNTAQITTVGVTNFYFDAATNSPFFLQDPDTYTGNFGGHRFSDGFVFDGDNGITWDIKSASGQNLANSISNVHVYNMDTHGVYIGRAKNLTLTDITTSAVNQDGVYGAGFYIDANAENIILNHPTIRQDDGSNTPSAGIVLDASVDGAEINSPWFEDCTLDISADVEGRDFRMLGVVRTDASNSISADGSNILYPTLNHDTFILGTANAVSSINAETCWDGRVIRLIASGSVTVNDGSNLKLSGNFAMDADDVIVLECDGTNWYEISRSAN